MTDDLAKQRAYEAKRPKVGAERYPTTEFRVVTRDGRERIERAIGLSQIEAHWPDWVRIERVDWGGFF